MCGTLWGVVACAGCAYLSYVSYSRLQEGNYYRPREWWSVLTWAVWFVLVVGLLSETRCWRERIFFSLLLLNSTLACVLAAWTTAPPSVIQQAREISVVLWALAALASLLTLSNPAGTGTVPDKKQDGERI